MTRFATSSASPWPTWCASRRILVLCALRLAALVWCVCLCACGWKSPSLPDASSIILVKAQGDTATVTLLTQNHGFWVEQMTTQGHVGRNGVSILKREGDGHTPMGVYTLGLAFGVAENPGCRLPYHRVTEDDCWVDDPQSRHYNTLVRASKTQGAWRSAERLADFVEAYRFAVAINYNPGNTPGRGSAIFLHCDTGESTAGCVAIPADDMRRLLPLLRRDTLIVIQ